MDWDWEVQIAHEMYGDDVALISLVIMDPYLMVAEEADSKR